MALSLRMLSGRTFFITVFLSAFLLFGLQPILSKLLLPWFGGASSVWNACVLFFQVVLFLGYLYAHALTSHFKPRSQMSAQILLLCLAVVFLPILPGNDMKPEGGENPLFAIIYLLFRTAFVPYFALSATAPLLQAWMREGALTDKPYRYYSLSNLGSMIALLGYPFVVEPWLGTRGQATYWASAFLIFALSCGMCALDRGGNCSTEKASASRGETECRRPGLCDHFFWLTASGCGSLLLLGITNFICLDLAAVPLLWVIPLAIYLLTFILCFESSRWYSRMVFLLCVFALCGLGILVQSYGNLGAISLIAGSCMLLFASCMLCHGELAASKPDSRYLTEYYLSISAGGVIGGVFVNIIAPLVFSTYLEVPLGLLLSGFLVLFAMATDEGALSDSGKRAIALVGTCVAPAVILVFISWRLSGDYARERGFYGVIRIRHDRIAGEEVVSMFHGSTLHGLQFVSPEREVMTTSYYGPESGAGLVLSRYTKGEPRRIAVIGLGSGTLAAYGRRGDSVTFYEIDPMVVSFAKKYFTWLDKSAARIRIVLGDGRISLERESARKFDILVLDAFNGGSIPVHLLTVEASELYLRRLDPEGIVVAHISNRFLDLTPVLRGIERHFGLVGLLVRSRGVESLGTTPATYFLLARTKEAFALAGFGREYFDSSRVSERSLLWTDAKNSLFEVLM